MTSLYELVDSKCQLSTALEKYWRLRIGPSYDSAIVFFGDLEFSVIIQEDLIEDVFELKIILPQDYPDDIPVVFETGGRIPANFHKLSDGSLCLGAPTEILGRVRENPTLIYLIEQIIIPYLAGFAWFSKRGTMPFGELPHGKAGLIQHFCDLFNTKDTDAAMAYVFLASLRRRFANSYRCPCGRGRRLGRCHNLLVNRVRDRHGRKWFQQQYQYLISA